jgi:hypothetical protein
MSWSQQNIENYTKEMYDEAQKLTPTELLSKNLTAKTWSAVFLTLNASANNYKTDTAYLQELARQIPNNTVTSLEGTSRLIIWERIISGDILFEGKGLVFENDLYQVSGRANQILQTLTNKNFGTVNMHSTEKELEDIQHKWLLHLANKPVEENVKIECPNAKIPEITSLQAVQALILSLQDNPKKQQITMSCLKRLYKLDAMPTEKDSPAIYCNPDTYAYSYLGMLFGDKQFDPTKDAAWWQQFWNKNHTTLAWNKDTGIYEVKN